METMQTMGATNVGGNLGGGAPVGAGQIDPALQDVINQIHRLHSNSGQFGAQEATQWLMQWSVTCTYDHLLMLLQINDQLVSFQAANFIAQKAQAGKNASNQIADQVLNAICSSQNNVVKRQLCVAYADFSLHGFGDLSSAVQKLQGAGQSEAMFEILKIFPEEVRSAKVAIDGEERMKFISKLLVYQEEVLNRLGSDQSTSNQLKLQACEQWLSLPSPQLIASRQSGAKFTAEIIRRRVHAHSLLQMAKESLTRECRETADAATGTLISLLNLTNEYNEMTAPAIALVAEAAIQLATALNPVVDGDSWIAAGPTSPNLDEYSVRLFLVSRILAEMGQHFYRALGKAEWCAQLGDVALHWLKIRQVEIARGGLEFWYGCLACHYSDQGVNREKLYPFMERYTFAVLECTKYPFNPENQEGFETDHFVRFREHCNQCLTEAVRTVLPVSWVIHLVGDKMQKMTQWNDLDSAIFILTGVAPRAPAGHDNVIPKLIQSIPEFAYPDNGLPALLLRISAGRLVLYTAGYLSVKEEALVPTLRFLMTRLLPALPRIACDDKDLKQYSQAICVDALRITTQSAKETLVELDNGNFWKEILSQIVELILNGGFHPDVRSQMVFSGGHIIGALKDPAEMEQTLAAFVQKLEPQVDLSQFQSNEGKGPPELKLYIAALSCCYDVTISTETQNGIPPTHHPVIRYWESQWDKIQQLTIMAVEKQWEDYLEQFCMSLNFIFQSARNFAISSDLLRNSLELLGNVAEQRPIVQYYDLHPVKEVDDSLVRVLGRFAIPVSRMLRQQQCPPDITAACFEMLGDALRWSNLANGSLQSEWLKEVFDTALTFLQHPDEIATHEAALTAVLRFFCSFLRWASEGPEVVKNARPLWEGEGRIKALIEALLGLLARCAENPRASTVGAVAEVIRPMLNGPMEFEAKTFLKQGFENLPPPLRMATMDSHKIGTG